MAAVKPTSVLYSAVEYTIAKAAVLSIDAEAPQETPLNPRMILFPAFTFLCFRYVNCLSKVIPRYLGSILCFRILSLRGEC